MCSTVQGIWLVVWLLADELLSDIKWLVKFRGIYKKHQWAELNNKSRSTSLSTIVMGYCWYVNFLADLLVSTPLPSLVTIRSNGSALNRLSDLSENHDSRRFPVPEYSSLVIR